MAEENDKLGTPGIPPTPPAEGAGTKAHKPKADPAKLPGGADFDADNASAEDFDKHTEILRRRTVLAGLAAPVQQVALVQAPAATAEVYRDPTDIRAVKGSEERYFTQLTWDAMETKGEHQGWEVTVPKPAAKL